MTLFDPMTIAYQAPLSKLTTKESMLLNCSARAEAYSGVAYSGVAYSYNLHITYYNDSKTP